MYDYLAKVILLGPSGSGKFVHTWTARQALELISFQVLPPTPNREERMSVECLYSRVFLEADRVKGECYPARQSALNFPPKSSKLGLAFEAKESSYSYGTQLGLKDSARYRDPTIVVQPVRF